jgi:hypothetical protein
MRGRVGRGDGFRYRSTRPTAQTFIGRSCVYGKRMDTGFEFVGERFVDHAMASNPALPPERVSYDINSEMRFSAGTVSGVALMLMGFVEHLQAQGSEGLGELLRNGFLHTHRSLAQAVDGADSVTSTRQIHNPADGKHVPSNLSSLRDAVNPPHNKQ